MAEYPDPSVVYDFDPHNLPAGFLNAIGLVTAASAQTESILETFIAGCLGVDQEFGIAVTSHMPAPLRDNVARSVAEIRIDDVGQLDVLDDILNEIIQAQNKRNETVHHTWAIHPETGEIYRVKMSARGSVRITSVPVTINDVQLDAEFIYQAGLKLQEFMIRNDLLPRFPPVRPRGHKLRSERKKRGAAK